MTIYQKLFFSQYGLYQKLVQFSQLVRGHVRHVVFFVLDGHDILLTRLSSTLVSFGPILSIYKVVYHSGILIL